MNYFQKHLGDYAKKTGHLTALEHGVYNLILDAYYDREQGPTLVEATRWARARTEEEKSAVLAVLDEFFMLGEDGRHTQSRVEEEIAKASGKMEEAEDRRKNERDRQARHRDRRKQLFADLRDHGEVPDFDTPTEQLQLRLNTHMSRVTQRVHTEDATATQYPIPNTQYPVDQNKVAAAPDVLEAPAVKVAEKRSKAIVVAAMPDLPEWMPADAWAGYLDMRKKQKKLPTLRALELVIIALGKMRDAGHDVASVLDTSTRNCWTDVYPPKQAGGGAQGRPGGRPSINSIGVAPGADDDIFNQMRKGF